ncbi:MAG: cysteate synthase [Methanomassiliicoccus sp.]|nr:cysteate synthase [Methanomassiliicoccus sp.]
MGGTMGNYMLECTGCRSRLDERANACPDHDALLRPVYEQRSLTISPYKGIWQYCEWLPVHGIIKGFTGGPVTYRSEGLARELGLDRLYISFNGYWPERGASLPTCSFKDLEAPPTVQRLMDQGRGDVLVVASAGNTARAFANLSSITRHPLVLLVPSSALGRLWLPSGANTAGSIFVLAVGGDYSDAIVLGDAIARRPGFVPEGGARNVARRDGMGVVMLDAVRTIGELPSHYFQAIGSGTGGIAAWEASIRLIADGRFGTTMPILHLGQNLPCAPIYDKVHGGSFDPSCPHGMVDEVLFNRRPPFSVAGGVADALRATGGEVLGMTNQQSDEAKALFLESEGIDIMPAASVAVAALVQRVKEGAVGRNETVLLNITGGGAERFRREEGTKDLIPDLTVKGQDQDIEAITSNIFENLREVM